MQPQDYTAVDGMLACITTELAGVSYRSVQMILEVEGVGGEEFVEGVDGEHLALEDTAEVGGDAVRGLLERGGRGLWGLEFERGDGAVGDAAGDDPVEVAEVGGDVEGEAVRGDRLGNVDADGCDFFLADAAAGEGPDSGEFTDALSGDAEVFAGVDEDFFHEADEVDGAEVGAALAGEVAAEVEDGVADELAGAMISDVAAAVDLVDLDAASGEEIVGREDVGAGGVAAESEDGRVFEEEERVADGSRFARCYDLGLDTEAFGVGDAAELEEMHVHGIATGRDR